MIPPRFRAPCAGLLAAFPVLAACGALDDLPRPAGPGLQVRDEPLPTALATPTRAGDALAEIARLEEARDDGGGLLEILAGMFEERVRVRATLALGRLDPRRFGARVTDALGACLADPVADVRAAAAFSLGQRGDRSAAALLSEHWLDPEPAVRAAIVEAAGKVDDPALRARVLASFSSPLVEVRRAAVLAPHRWTAGEPDAADEALVELLMRPTEGSALAERARVPERATEDPEVIWRALFSLERRGTGAGRDVFLRHASSPDDRARIFAVRGLGSVPPDEVVREALEAQLTDEDWRIVVEAVRSLAKLADRRSLGALERLLEHPTHHVRATLAEALARFPADAGAADVALEPLLADREPVVRAAALGTLARRRGAAAAGEVAAAAGSEDALVRAGAAAAAGQLEAAATGELLLALSRDGDRRVAGAAVAGLARQASDAGRARLAELCRGEDDGLRLAAVEGLGAAPRPQDLDALVFAYGAARADLAVDVRCAALRAASELGGAPALAFLRQGSSDPHRFVRETADRLRREQGDVPAATAPTNGRTGELPPGPETYPSNPFVELVTTRGTMLFELFPEEAPGHVHSFLELARRDHYDGTSFHRVVPDFVIQGGCYRGDGNGGGTWRGPGDSLRHEFGRRPFVRGSLGMPRGEDEDSGGSQLFVTHRPTPHLDGAYTIFGELRDGFDVLDAIAVGDRILDVRRVVGH